MKPKNLVPIMLFTLVVNYTTLSQSRKSISTFGGYSDDGFAAMVNFQYYTGQSFDKFYEIGIYTGFLKEKETQYKVPLNVYTINAGYHFRIDKISSMRNTIVTTFGVGGVFGKEELNKGSKELSNGALITSKDGLIYGGYGAIETDIYITKNLSLLGRYTHFYHANSDVGKSKFMIGLGLKYIFI